MTKRLLIRSLRESDFEAVHSYSSVLENVRYMPFGPNTEEDTRAFLRECAAKEAKVPRLDYDLALTLKRNGRLIGACGIYLNTDRSEGMVGWILHRDYWRQGYVTEAARWLIRFGFEELKLHRIIATCITDNYGSFRVMENCGMRREAHFIKCRKARDIENKPWYDEYVYAILDEEYFAQQQNGASFFNAPDTYSSHNKETYIRWGG